MSTVLRAQLQKELAALAEAETRIDEDLHAFFVSLSEPGNLSSSSSGAVSAEEMRSTASKIDAFSPHFEGMVQNSKKLSLQVNDCHALSDRVSVMVRRLDTVQIRAQQALACIEEIMNLKECRAQLEKAVKEKNLPVAVQCVQQVHKISPDAAATSEDYALILEQEKLVKGLVQAEFASAIRDSNLPSVMALCPMLQTLGLEAVARDQFLDFVGEHVFIAVTADGAAAGSTTDAATAYATALSNVFNNAYLILQKYLPMVIQGMENSYGDVHFLQRLHSRCEREAGMVLKRYMAYRDVKAVLSFVRGETSGQGQGGGGKLLSQSLGGNIARISSSMTDASAPYSEKAVHILLDELALLIQYCTLYSKYIKSLCVGSQGRLRPLATDVTSVKDTDRHVAAVKGAVSKSSAADIFPGPVSFDKMVDELVSSYYMESERWIMHKALHALPLFNEQAAQVGFLGVGSGKSTAAPADAAEGGGADAGLDEAFYVLQRCGLRAVSTNNIHAACAILHYLSDLLVAELHEKLVAAMVAASEKLSLALLAHVSKIVKQTRVGVRSLANVSHGGAGMPEGESYADDAAGSVGDGFGVFNFEQLDKTFLSGYRNAVALATSIGGKASISGASSSAGASGIGSAGASAAGAGADKEYTAKISAFLSKNRGQQSGSGSAADARASNDPYGVAECTDVFNMVEKCGRYVARLGSEVVAAGEALYGASSDKNTPRSGPGSGSGGHMAPEADMLNLCKDEFVSAKACFSASLRTEFERLAESCKLILKDIFLQILGPRGPLGGVRFDAPDDTFDQQPALSLLPAALLTPIEAIITVSTFDLSESNKELFLGMLVDVCCDRIEHYVMQTGFRLAGSLKFEECVRAIIACFSRASTVPLRSRFSRLREVLMVLTSDSRGASFAENLSQLTLTEAQAVISLRRD